MFRFASFVGVISTLITVAAKTDAVNLRYSYTLRCQERHSPSCNAELQTSKVTVNLVDGRVVECGTESFDAGYEVIPDEPLDDFFDPLESGVNEWRLAFRGTPYVGYSVYDAYQNGSGIPENVEPGCKSINSSKICSNHYRNNAVLDNWTNIDRILFAVYKGDKVVHHLIFNGFQTSFMDWFAPEKLSSSTWVDLKRTETNYFGIAGHPELQRRFFISKLYNSCPNDAGWFVAVNQINPPCAWESERINAFPMFKYATGPSLITWTTGEKGLADAIGVFVQYSSGH